MDLENDAPEWGRARRMLFRFVFVYFFLLIFPFPLSVIPGVQAVVQPYQSFWDAMVPSIGARVFGVQITEVVPNGSGDRTYDYVQVFCFACLALVTAVCWSILDRRRRDYARLYEWLRVYVRFYLAVTMLSYGGYKAIKSQFSSPSLDALLEPLGEMSPMGLLWRFMGASDSYTIFTGIAEMLGGLLLVSRRTTTLGALICMGVLANVVMLNMSYDVPVKLFSSHLLAMAVFLILPDLRRLANLLVFNRPTEPAELRPLFARPLLNRSGLVFRTLFILTFAAMALYQSWSARSKYGDAAPKPPLYGIWNVEEFAIDGQVRPPLLTDKERWRRMVFSRVGAVSIYPMEAGYKYYSLKLDPIQRNLRLSKPSDPKSQSVLSYTQP
ncbi:MAG TPA: hypothetical protein VLE27_02305, partial [Thermoanaerobaculia bacterium]|nr:hypothetical protein [Thermoanaerobaculia bacterium]